MNLPLIFDVILGLIFVYLTLSLLAAEIQEMFATVFQWRAQHLRKSIEILLAGGTDQSQEGKVIQLANNIYKNPLIQSLNQEAKGFLVTLPRRLTWSVGLLYRLVKGVNADYTAFGLKQHSAPSYIPAENFASSVIDTLQIPTLVDSLTASRLEKFRDERLADIEKIIANLQQEIDIDGSLGIMINDAYTKLEDLKANFQITIEDFEEHKYDLESSIQRMNVSFDSYIESLQIGQATGAATTKTVGNLRNLRQELFSNPQQAIVSAGMRPNLNEVAQMINTSSSVYQELTGFLERKDSALYQQISGAISALPPSLSENIITLVKGAQTRIDSAEEGVTALRNRLESAFDKSMDRASGVYKRNAKGVAILIGIALAVSTNTDTFHMVSRLSKDSALRQTVTQNAGEIVVKNNPNSTVDLERLKESTEEVLDKISLPVGWTDNNIKQQFLSDNQQKSSSLPIIGGIKSLLGWIVSGIAISMGAPFWFDLVSKVTNVRNTGKLPNSGNNSRNSRNPDSYYDIENVNNYRR